MESLKQEMAALHGGLGRHLKNVTARSPFLDRQAAPQPVLASARRPMTSESLSQHFAQ